MRLIIDREAQPLQSTPAIPAHYGFHFLWTGPYFSAHSRSVQCLHNRTSCEGLPTSIVALPEMEFHKLAALPKRGYHIANPPKLIHTGNVEE